MGDQVPAAVAARMREQAGVVSRSQVLALGGRDTDIERLLRRRVWARVHTGVYADHTGPLSWLQRAWAAVLLREPAALDGASALRVHGLRTGGAPADGPVDVLVPHRRRAVDPSGVRTSRSREYDALVLGDLAPPRVRLEHAVLSLAAAATAPDASVALLADACQSRRTTPERLALALADRPRLPGRALLGEVLSTVEAGALSALERRYLLDVERAHALPRARRQARRRLGTGIAEHDVAYEEYGVLVELDGRLRHEAARDRWRDLSRDLADAADGQLTVRLGWRQALDPCPTAVGVGAVLRARGWAGAPRPCPLCANADRGVPSARGAGRTPRSA